MIIERAPTAGLWEGQTDEGEMGLSYERLDQVIRAMETKKLRGVERKDLVKVKKAMETTAHKRALPIVFEG